MTPIQQLMLGVGAKKKVYLDDVFSTFLYEGKGDNTTNSVSNNVDLTEDETCSQTQSGNLILTHGADIKSKQSSSQDTRTKYIRTTPGRILLNEIFQ